MNLSHFARRSTKCWKTRSSYAGETDDMVLILFRNLCIEADYFSNFKSNFASASLGLDGSCGLVSPAEPGWNVAQCNGRPDEVRGKRPMRKRISVPLSISLRTCGPFSVRLPHKYQVRQGVFLQHVGKGERINHLRGGIAVRLRCNWIWTSTVPVWHECLSIN